MTCTVCNEAMGDDPRVMCRSCARSYARNKIAENTILSVIEWAADRARRAEHRRMADKVNGLELKLHVEIATTNAIIRKYGNTTTEIGDINAK